jgi:hypothetical protein
LLDAIEPLACAASQADGSLNELQGWFQPAYDGRAARMNAAAMNSSLLVP